MIKCHIIGVACTNLSTGVVVNQTVVKILIFYLVRIWASYRQVVSIRIAATIGIISSGSPSICRSIDYSVFQSILKLSYIVTVKNILDSHRRCT